MVLFSIGLPSRLAECCDALLQRLAEHRFGSVQAVALNSLEELAAAVIRSSAASILACSRQPVVRLQSEIVAAGHPFLVALGDPRAALRNLVERTGNELPHATRAVASSCAAVLGIAKAGNALVLSPDRMTDAAAAAMAVAQHFNIQIGSGELAQIADYLTEQFGSEEDDSGRWVEGLSEREQAIVNGALDSYIAHFAGRELERVVWEPELFYTTTDPAGPGPTPAAGPIDITGRVRFLIYGPFINLPPGAWSADIVIGFSAEAAGMSFLVEVFAGVQLAHTRIEVSGERVVETRLYFAVEATLDHPVQIRVFNERAAFDGRLALGYVALTPQAALPDDMRQRLADALQR